MSAASCPFGEQLRNATGGQERRRVLIALGPEQGQVKLTLPGLALAQHVHEYVSNGGPGWRGVLAEKIHHPAGDRARRIDGVEDRQDVRIRQAKAARVA